ncbi:LLM class flavin-dependent oxidoreductase [Solirubrobacter phytolaccae]|uniref:LLM class flavin-dependent oxidoreductase n=1 Tax=Solirubrobacter phytolaccae TaxID=1404360 RepID=A0A9X3NAI5_9ACTN|nr:LLM class flavin-dependent oxidoreductase [Solirubrobacter phytolaccae]MDA0183040.1 LLM class flavin-dependent oxidoreductase [Solirubrobacter phytolaccae]
MSRRLRLNAFTMNVVSHIVQGQWTRPDTRQRDYTSLEPWVELAKLLEKGRFDAIFFADVIGAYDVYNGNRDAAVRRAVQFPVNDPSALIPALGLVTEHLGLAFTLSILQEHPFSFARRASTLDHYTRGRVGWNIVTSYLENAANNLGYRGLPLHDTRYDRGDEYLDVVYKLWEGSWEDDAVLADTERGVYADPAKVHEIDHRGEYYDVAGPHLSEPSPQRTPVLFQAGSSERGREFAARHAEATFISARNIRGARANVDDLHRRLVLAGRRPDDLLVFQGLTVITAATEGEARRKEREVQEHLSDEGTFAVVSGWLGTDLSAVDPDAPVGDLRTNAQQGIVKSLAEAAPDKTWTFRDLIFSIANRRIVGTPEHVADELERWHVDGGIDGVNLTYTTTPGSFEDFIDGVVPVLQDRGVVQREYHEGTFREKLFDGRVGPRLADTHPGTAYRRKAVVA